MDAELYYYKIITQYLLPFVVLKYNLDCYPHQNNDKKHTARIYQKLTDLAKIWVKNIIL